MSRLLYFIFIISILVPNAQAQDMRRIFTLSLDSGTDSLILCENNTYVYKAFNRHTFSTYTNSGSYRFITSKIIQLGPPFECPKFLGIQYIPNEDLLDSSHFNISIVNTSSMIVSEEDLEVDSELNICVYVDTMLIPLNGTPSSLYRDKEKTIVLRSREQVLYKLNLTFKEFPYGGKIIFEVHYTEGYRQLIPCVTQKCKITNKGSFILLGDR